MKSNHNDIRNLSDVEQEHVIEYLKYRQHEGISSYSISKDMAALNKLFNLQITKKMADIKSRTYNNITRSLGQKAHDKKYNPENYKDQITFAKSCGCRRESVLVVTPKRFTWENGLPVKVYLIEKGGKPRHATILKSYQGTIKSIIENKELSKPLFDRYTKKIDNHAFRREFAKNRYAKILGVGSDKKDYRGYDKEVLKKLTKD